MTSPVPWADAKTRLVAAFPGVWIKWPNEYFAQPTPDDLPGGCWMAVEAAGDVLQPVEIGPGGSWQEEGTIFVHVFVPTGTGTDIVNQAVKDVSNAFRFIEGARPFYPRCSLGMGEAGSDDGIWWRRSVSVDYRYLDHQIP